jgi:hypothetical protein
MRRQPDYLEGKQPVLVYIARRLNEALALEEALTTSGVDYVVEADEYFGGFIFQQVRTGAFFYVAPESEEAARQAMLRNGYKPQEPQ